MAASIVYWERRDADGWRRYDDVTSAAIQTAEDNGDASVDFTENGTSYQVQFFQEGPKQVNPVTDYRRDVRRVVNPLGSNPGQAAVQWEWFDGSAWEPYPPEVSVKVEATRVAGEGECDFTTLYGQDYRIEFGSDGWQLDPTTGEVVRVRKVTLPPPPAAGQATPQQNGGSPKIVRRSARLAGRSADMTSNGAGPSVSEPDEYEEPISAADFPSDGSVHPSLMRSVKEPEDDDCVVCYESLRDKPAVRLMLCRHVYHLACIKKCFAQKPKCPTCMRAYGVRTGNQPDNGTMTVQTFSWKEAKKEGITLDGHKGKGVIMITYNFPHGIQGPNHPNPGTHYSGTNRTAYLVDDPQGREVLRLLEIAFDRRITFTVGRSQTTGRDNQVVWSGIHHKTHTAGGPAQHGYPDETYHARVKAELAEFGVTL